MPAPLPTRSQLPRELPLVGRSADLEDLHTVFGETPHVEPLVIMKGDGGIGKSRLARTVGAEARRRGWQVITGRAYPVETGAPYALLSDAFLPLLRDMDDSTLTVLSRGNLSDLRRLFPSLGPADRPLVAGDDPRELQTRLYWSFTDFATRLAGRDPLLIVLEDLHWADASSLALLHFMVRHLSEEPVRVLATYNTEYRDDSERLIRLERSFLNLRKLRLLPLAPLSRESTHELIRKVFDASGPAVAEFADILFGWTRGNPYFMEQTLETLVASGRLYERDGTWLGWEARELELPASVRDAIGIRVRRLSDEAVRLAEILAVVGSPATVGLLTDVSGIDPRAVVSGVEELVRSALVEEQAGEEGILLQFRHPLTRETLYQGLSLTRRRASHRAVAEALERHYGGAAVERADELAYHFVQGADREGDPRATHYLIQAGRSALLRHADREAADYLDAAVGLLTETAEVEEPESPEAPPDPPDVTALKRELARARARLGQYEAARGIWEELLETSERSGEERRAAQAHRHLGLIAFWTGAHERALEHYDRALELLGDEHPRVRARIHVASGLALQELGRSDDGRRAVERALALGEEIGDEAMLARVHRALALLFIFTGDAEHAREHGWKAVELADRAGDDHVSFWGRWALAALEALAGGPAAIQELLAETAAMAERLRSPVLELWVKELEIEHAYYSGDWNRALAEGERAIVRATNLNQRQLMVRLLVWTAECYLGRGDLDRGREMVERAWEAAGLGPGGGGRRRDVHAVVPAYIGRVALLMAEGRYDEAIRVGNEGLAVADRIGYVIWVLHQLLPLVAEAYLQADRLDEARPVVERLRREGARMDHRIALAYADAGDAVVAWHSGEIEEGAARLRSAAESMEALGIVYEAARLRRQLAGRLTDLGDRDGALSELRRLEDTFEELGAWPELEKARVQIKENDGRPRTIHGHGKGSGGLTPRETDVAREVASRKSNKAIAKSLGIAERTVTTHLTNIYRKLGLRSRGELVDMVREGRLG